MSELERVRDDLAVIRGAAGLELPFGWEDVWLCLAFVPAGVFLSVWGAFSPWSLLKFGGVPILLVAAGTGGLRYRYRRSTGRSPIRRREYTFGLITGGLMGVLAWVFMVWERSLGVSTALVGAAAVFFAGVICVILALSDRGRRSCWAAAVALFVFAFVIPYCTPRQVLIAAGAACSFTGLACAAIQAWQLRSLERQTRHEPASH